MLGTVEDQEVWGDAFDHQYFQVNEIIPNRLYISAHTDHLTEAVKRRGIGLIVNNTHESSKPIEGTTLIRFPFHDSVYPEDLPNFDQLRSIAKFAKEWNEMTGKPVLAHCAAGLNRSGLTSAFIMKEMNPELSGTYILEHIRSVRVGALFNRLFARIVEEL